MFVAGLVKYFLGGEAETLGVIAAPVIGGVITYFGRSIASFLLAVHGYALFHFNVWLWRRSLDKMAKKRGISKAARQRYRQKREELDDLLADEFVKRAQQRIKQDEDERK